MKKATTHKKTGLANPAAIAVASSPAGQKAVGAAADVVRIQAETGSKILLFTFKVFFVVGGCYLAYKLFQDRFQEAQYRSNLDDANISDFDAEAKADAIYDAMAGPGANKEAVAAQLSGLNTNGYLKVYNAFGKREPFLGIGDAMTMNEWIRDQFKGYDLEFLQSVLPGMF